MIEPGTRVKIRRGSFHNPTERRYQRWPGGAWLLRDVFPIGVIESWMAGVEFAVVRVEKRREDHMFFSNEKRTETRYIRVHRDDLEVDDGKQ